MSAGVPKYEPTIIPNLTPISTVSSDKEAANIAHSLALGRLTHAVLLSGDELLCREIFLLGASILSRQAHIESVDNPDILILSGAKMQVTDVESILEELLTPPRLSRRMIYISHAGLMSEVVQNKLLKTFEEPPPNNQFVLSGADGLLPTLYSRLMRVLLPPVLLSKQSHKTTALLQLANRDKQADLDSYKAQYCLELTGDLLDEALAAATDENALMLFKTAFDWFLSTSPKYILEIPAEFTLSRENLTRVLGVFCRVLSDMLRCQEGYEPHFFDGERKQAILDRAQSANSKELFAAFDACVFAQERLRANAPAKQTLDNLYAQTVYLNAV